MNQRAFDFAWGLLTGVSLILLGFAFGAAW
jgi:hypothetical protein